MTRSPHFSMVLRLWRLSLTMKRPQAGLAVASMLVGAAVVAALLNLYGGVRRKMTEEFRAYGPNVVLAPGGGAATADSPRDASDLMDERVISRVKILSEPARGLVAVPVLYVVVLASRASDAGLDDGLRPIDAVNAVAVGTDLEALERLNPGWRVDGPRVAPALTSCAVGAHLARRLGVSLGGAAGIEIGATARLPYHLVAQSFTIANVITTGASEDDQIFLPLNSLQRLAALGGLEGLEGKVSLVQLRVPGDTADVERAVGELAGRLPGVEVRPLRPIVESEGRVLGIVRWLMLSLTSLIVVIVLLSVMATVTVIVLERRRDVAVMKALGASDRMVMGLFLGEVATLGLAAGLAGCLLGLLMARGLAARLFAASLTPLWWTLPTVTLATIALALGATLKPVGRVRAVEPAAVLKGE